MFLKLDYEIEPISDTIIEKTLKIRPVTIMDPNYVSLLTSYDGRYYLEHVKGENREIFYIDTEKYSKGCAKYSWINKNLKPYVIVTGKQ